MRKTKFFLLASKGQDLEQDPLVSGTPAGPDP
jgi:hypothetical protein